MQSMKRGASLKEMPELADLTENEQWNILSESGIRIFGCWQVWAGMIGCVAVGLLGGSVGRMVGGNLGNVLGATLMGGIGGYFLIPTIVRLQAREIRKIVAERKPKSVL